MGSVRFRASSRQDRRVDADIIQWDINTWKYGLTFWGQRIGNLDNKLGLEVGSRDGGLSLFLALKGCRVVCSDLRGPTARARELHRDYGVGDRVSYEGIDVKEIPFPDEHFDLVILKSTLGALGSGDGTLKAQRDAISEIHRVLKREGQFLFAENMRGSPMHVFLRRHFVPWGRNWHYFTGEQIGDLLSGFTTVDLSFRGFAAALGRREWQRGLLHGVDGVLLPLLPRAFRYVVFGCAVK